MSMLCFCAIISQASTQYNTMSVASLSPFCSLVLEMRSSDWITESRRSSIGRRFVCELFTDYFACLLLAKSSSHCNGRTLALRSLSVVVAVVAWLKCVQSRCEMHSTLWHAWETFSRSDRGKQSRESALNTWIYITIKPMQLSNYCIKLLPWLYITRYLTTTTATVHMLSVWRSEEENGVQCKFHHCGLRRHRWCCCRSSNLHSRYCKQQPESIRLYRKHSAITQIELKSINEEMENHSEIHEHENKHSPESFGHTFIEARSAARRTDEMHSLIWFSIFHGLSKLVWYGSHSRRLCTPCR